MGMSLRLFRLLHIRDNNLFLIFVCEEMKCLSIRLFWAWMQTYKSMGFKKGADGNFAVLKSFLISLADLVSIVLRKD